VSSPTPLTHTVPPSVQTPGLLPQQGSSTVPQELPPDTQPLAVQVPPPRPDGHGLPSAMQVPFLVLQQAPSAQVLSGQQRPLA
jgi:hypothetical protein